MLILIFLLFIHTEQTETDLALLKGFKEVFYEILETKLNNKLIINEYKLENKDENDEKIYYIEIPIISTITEQPIIADRKLKNKTTSQNHTRIKLLLNRLLQNRNISKNRQLNTDSKKNLYIEITKVKINHKENMKNIEIQLSNYQFSQKISIRKYQQNNEPFKKFITSSINNYISILQNTIFFINEQKLSFIIFKDENVNKNIIKIDQNTFQLKNDLLDKEMFGIESQFYIIQDKEKIILKTEIKDQYTFEKILQFPNVDKLYEQIQEQLIKLAWKARIFTLLNQETDIQSFDLDKLSDGTQQQKDIGTFYPQNSQFDINLLIALTKQKYNEINNDFEDCPEKKKTVNFILNLEIQDCYGIF